jgi:hypothetical protein
LDATLNPTFAIAVVFGVAAASCGGARSASAPDGGGLDAPGGHPDADAADVGAEAGPSTITLVTLDRVGIGSYGSSGWPQVGQARADLDWGPGPFAKVILTVDLDTTCFPFNNWSADPPPAGQNWPADCDAFDRNFDLFIDDAPPGADGGGPTPFEVIHAITPFGGPEHLEVDLTDLANGLPGRHGLRVDLGSYADPQGLVTGSNGGWTVSARVAITSGDPPRRVLAVVPLYAGAIGAGDPFPVISWDVPAGASGGRLEYRTSGHGQGPAAPRCNGPAEEFCDRTHQILVDGAEVDNIEPYRQDCQTLCTVAHQGPPDAGFDYCAENPCGAIDSVEAARANWCPGSMTAPFVWESLPALAIAGPHTFSFQILNIAPGGTWMASAIYLAYGR